MSNTPEISSLQKVVADLQTAIQSGDCTQMNAKIKDVLKEAQPVQNLIQVGKMQESDESISTLKAEIRVATGEILQKCPKGKTNNVKTNNVKTNNVKANNVKTNNVKTNNVKTNNVKTNNVKNTTVKNNANTSTTNANTVKTNNVSATPVNTNTAVQTGGKRSRRKSMRKSRRSRKM